MNSAIKIVLSEELRALLPGENGVVGYARVSSEQEDRQTLSPQAQAGMIRAYANLHGLGEVTMFYERKSAKNLSGRPELRQILAWARGGQVRHLIVCEITRLTRDLGDALKVFAELDRCNVQLHGATRQIDRSTADGKFVSDLDVILGERERRKIGERTKAALVAKPRIPFNPKDHPALQSYALKGYYLGQAQCPRGYRWKKRIVNGKAKVVAMEEHPAEMAAIRMMFALRWQGKTYQEIAAALCAAGVRTRRRGLYTFQVVERIIHTSMYWPVVDPNHIPQGVAHADPNAPAADAAPSEGPAA